MARWIVAVLALLLGVGCASHPLERNADDLAREFPESAKVDGVPFIKQRRNHCGPASLAMVMQWAGKAVSATSLADKMITPDKAGTFQQDLVGAARREGFLAIPLVGYDALFRELAAGNPVVVFQNVGVSFWPLWHYAVVFGYDFPKRRMLVHSGGNAYDDISFRHFGGDWEGGDRWGLVVLPANKMSASGDELAHLTAASALENLGFPTEAELAYRNILGRWPRSLGALIGLANVRYAAKDLQTAARSLEEATRFHEKVAATWHNLALVYAELGRKQLAKQTARKALQLVAPSEADAYHTALDPLL